MQINLKLQFRFLPPSLLTSFGQLKLPGLICSTLFFNNVGTVNHCILYEIWSIKLLGHSGLIHLEAGVSILQGNLNYSPVLSYALYAKSFPKGQIQPQLQKLQVYRCILTCWSVFDMGDN